MRHALLVASLCLLAVAPVGGAAAAGAPNVLYIMSDDHAAHAMSAYASRINQTPQLDRIARDGMRFDRCYAVNSICTPSRAAILTGKYSHANGVPVFNRFDGSQPTLAKYLKAAGYHTGMIGKWHLGSDPTGFDHWIILPGQGVYHDPVFLVPGGSVDFKGYVTDIITDLSIEFLEKRPKDRPFFLMCHHKAPHRHWQPDSKHATMYDDRDIPEPATLRDTYEGRADAARQTTMTVARHLTRNDLKLAPPAGLVGPERQKWLSACPDEVTIEVGGETVTLTGDALVRWKYQRYIKDYLRCVASIDDNVGRLLDYLDRTGLAANTVVVYTSDQGFFLGDHGWYDKRFMYDESVRMPFIVRWPGVTKPGSTQAAIALNVDFAPTFLEAAGLPVAPDMQGRSLVPLLRGERPADWRTSWYYRYYHDPGHHNTRAHYGVGTETHKLIHFWKIDQWELYDLVSDPEELRNVYGDPARAEVVASLTKELSRLKAELKDEDQYADKLPPDGVDVRPPPRQASRARETGTAPDRSTVPGVVIDHSPASARVYIGSPSIAVLPAGDYVASHDLFGPGCANDTTRVFGSSDKGKTWSRRAEIKGQWWSTLFVHEGALYIMGTSREHGHAVIRRSTDGGAIWTAPTDAKSGLLLGDGRYHCAPVPVLVHNGRLWRAMEDAMGPGWWGSHFRAFMMSAPAGADLLDAGNWTTSNRIGRDPAWLGGAFGGWLEGNAVAAPGGEVVNILRVDVRPEGGKAAAIAVSADGTRASFDPAAGFIDFPGGAKKFTIRFDPQAKRYWSLVNHVLEKHKGPDPGRIRNALALIDSPDLRAWTVRSILLYHPDVEKHGFQYVDWLFEGDDIIAVARTAYDDGLGGAHNQHDANYMTFHRFARFRDRTMEDSAGP